MLLLLFTTSGAAPATATVAAKLERTSTLKGATRVRTFNA